MKRAMDTISTILGPSITLSQPLVGGSLASDWVRFSKSSRLIGQCMAIAQRHASLSFLYIDVITFMYMYIKDQWTLSAPL